jgi:hypothetical protein
LDPIKLFDGSDDTRKQIKLFRQAQWTEEEFARRLANCIRTKCERYRATEKGPFDVLLVLSAEPFLRSKDVIEWMQNWSEIEYPSFKEVFLLLDYEASYPKGRYPLFKVK